MDNVVPLTIQIIAIAASLSFLFYIARLIIKGKLREEYSIVWVIGAVFLIIFSFWRNGLELMAKLLGVYDPPNLLFMAAIFIIFIYLLHLSVVMSKLQYDNKKLSQQLALMKEKMEKENKENEKIQS